MLLVFGVFLCWRTQRGCELLARFMERKSTVQTQLSTDERTHKHCISMLVNYYNDPPPQAHTHLQPLPLKLLHRFPSFTFLNHEIWLNGKWDHGRYKEPINKGQMCFVEILQDITLMNMRIYGGKNPLLTQWLEKLQCKPPTHTLSIMSMKVQNKGVHLLSVFHKVVIKQTKVLSLTHKLIA